MRRAIYPGSFDPTTNGHLDVIERAVKLFDEVVVAVAANSQKQPLFTGAERTELMRRTTAERGLRVRVVQLEGLLVEVARELGAVAIIRGLRAVSDFEFEFQMALMNRKLEAGVETIFLMPKEEYTYLSSRIVKEIARLGGAVDSFVPACVVRALRDRFAPYPPSTVAEVPALPLVPAAAAEPGADAARGDLSPAGPSSHPLAGPGPGAEARDARPGG